MSMAGAARQAAAGACAFVADGDEESATQVLTLFMSDQMVNHDQNPIIVMHALVSAFMGVAVAAAGGTAEPFQRLGAHLASTGGEW